MFAAVSSNYTVNSINTITTSTYFSPTVGITPIVCKKRKGGPRSRIYCGVWKAVPHTTHIGRGRFKWFTWESKD